MPTRPYENTLHSIPLSKNTEVLWLSLYRSNCVCKQACMWIYTLRSTSNTASVSGNVQKGTTFSWVPLTAGISGQSTEKYSELTDRSEEIHLSFFFSPLDGYQVVVLLFLFGYKLLNSFLCLFGFCFLWQDPVIHWHDIHHAAQASFKFMTISLVKPPKCWGYRSDTLS